MRRAQSRRQFLAATCTTALAGCVFGEESGSTTTTTGSGSQQTKVTDPRPGLQGSPEGVPTFQYDDANTGYAPGNTGPTNGAGVLWRADLTTTLLAAPLVEDGTVYVVTAGTEVSALAGSDGTEQWTYEADTGDAASMAVVDGLVTLATDETVVTLDAADGTEQWRAQDENPGLTFGPPSVVDGTVYLGADDGRVTALSATEGGEQWTTETGAGIESALAVTDGAVYATSDDGTVYALDADGGTIRWTTTTGREDTDTLVGDATPTVVDGRVYVTNGTLVYAIDAADGTVVWTYQTDRPVEASVAVADGTVYATDVYGTVHALSAARGTEQWTSEVAGTVQSPPAVVDDTVYVASGPVVAALQAADGTERWRFENDAEIGSWPVVVAGVVYVGTGHSTVLALAEI